MCVSETCEQCSKVTSTRYYAALYVVLRTPHIGLRGGRTLVSTDGNNLVNDMFIAQKRLDLTLKVSKHITHSGLCGHLVR